MDNSELNIIILNNAASSMNKLVDGETDNISVYYLPLKDIVGYLENKGFIDNEDFDSNSWSWDFYMTMKYNNVYYSLSGSGYYSNIIQVSKIKNI